METNQEADRTSPPKPICQSCQAKMKGKFCLKCGEKRFKPDDLSLRKLGLEFWTKLTHLDSRFFNSLYFLMLKPGSLTFNYCHGMRKPFLKPVQLFFVANVLYFLILPFFKNDVFFFTPENYFRYRPLGMDFESMAKTAAAAKSIPWTEFIAALHAKMEILAKSWVVLNVPMLGLILAILHLNQRRFLVEHLVFAMHYYAFLMLFVCLLGGFSVMLEWAITSHQWSEDVKMAVNVLALYMFIYLGLALKKYYQTPWIWTLLRLALLYFCIIMILNIYRTLLFMHAVAQI